MGNRPPFFSGLNVPVALLLLVLLVPGVPGRAWCLASANVPLDSPVYLYLGKLAGLGLIDSDVAGLRPYSRAEAARLVLEAEAKSDTLDGRRGELARELLSRLEKLLSRELSLRRGGEAEAFSIDKSPAARLGYVLLDGIPRSFERSVYDPANQSAFGFIGGNLRPQPPTIIGRTGSEGTPLSENNEGVNYLRGSNVEARAALSAHFSDLATVLVEPDFLLGPGKTSLKLRKGYLKLGGGGAELEAGRDANWFGPGYRGALTLTNNARNFDMLKLSSPEPVDLPWVRKHLGLLKYALVLSRFDASGTGDDLREPWFVGVKLALRTGPLFEIGGNFVRQEGGPGIDKGGGGIEDVIFGGSDQNRNNSIAGIDLRFRVPALRNLELYGEYAGEDSAAFWPFVESYLAGFFLPMLTQSGRDDLRFEYLWGHQILYTDYKYPAGYNFNGMNPGHSQGGGTQEFFLRYSHWYSARSTLALEYFHTDRGRVGRVVGQAVEEKDAVRAFYTLPMHGDLDLGFAYGVERIRNLNLVPGAKRSNQILKLEVSHRY